jgi:hypothetical protein
MAGATVIYREVDASRQIPTPLPAPLSLRIQQRLASIGVDSVQVAIRRPPSTGISPEQQGKTL